MTKEELLEIEKIVNEGKSDICFYAPNRKQVKELIEMVKKSLQNPLLKLFIPIKDGVPQITDGDSFEILGECLNGERRND